MAVPWQCHKGGTVVALWQYLEGGTVGVGTAAAQSQYCGGTVAVLWGGGTVPWERRYHGGTVAVPQGRYRGGTVAVP